ncbi:MAG: VCBS repeat-containing protein [Anaerolineales bacterium]|nr:VCBS repeat-containing protein [Anaerolineales bacterium]
METAMSVTKHLKRLPNGLLSGFLLLAVLVGGLGYYHHHRQLERVKNDRQRDLSGIAAEKAHFVSAWRSQQYQEGRSLTGDGTLEVIVGRNGDQVTVYDRFGSVVWTRNPFGSGEVRTLAVADLETDGVLEIVAGRASGGSTLQLKVFEPNGSVRPGWPARRGRL